MPTATTLRWRQDNVAAAHWGHRAECMWHLPGQLWLYAGSRTMVQVCLNMPMHGWCNCASAFPPSKRRQECFPAPLSCLGGSSRSRLQRDHKSEALFCRGVYQKRPAIHVSLSLPLTVTLWIEVRSLWSTPHMQVRMCPYTPTYATDLCIYLSAWITHYLNDVVYISFGLVWLPSLLIKICKLWMSSTLSPQLRI